MLRLGVSRTPINRQLVGYEQRRHFLVSTALTLGGFVFGKRARLADAMENGELHNKNNDDEAIRKDRVDKRLRSLSETRPMRPRYEGHVPLYLHEKMLLFAISGLRSFFHPEDGNNIVQLGESSAFPFLLESLKKCMLEDETGRRILREQPNITSDTLDMERLGKMDKNSLGYTYYSWLLKEGVSPDTRAPVKYIDDPLQAFVFKRYRQCHDFYHAINGLPIIIEGEIAIKALEAANMGIPMAALGALLAPLRLKPVQKERLYDIYLPWAIRTGLSCKPLINVYWEELLEKDVNELRKNLGIQPPPDLRAIRQERSKIKNQLKMKYDAFEVGK